MGFTLRLRAKLILSIAALVPTLAHARASVSTASYAESSGFSLGLTAAILSLEQSKMDALIHRANSREGGISNDEMGTPYEFALTLESRPDASPWGYQLRPSYFTQTSHGSGTGGAFKYDVVGESIFMNFRRYMLENENIHLFAQFGLGYGHLKGLIEENDKSAPGHGRVSFDGDTLGLGAGMGADVCSTGGHCFTIEGSYRYMKFDRAIVTSTSGAFDTGNDSLSQYGLKQEVELDNQDLAVQMGGLIFQMGYAYKF